jgi:putative ABC transport system permease protein
MSTARDPRVWLTELMQRTAYDAMAFLGTARWAAVRILVVFRTIVAFGAYATTGTTRSLHLTLAWRNLFQDRLRFAATLIGIVFSIVLVMVQMGLYLGFGEMVTAMIDHASADLWIVATGTKSFEDPSLLDSAIQYRVLHIKGVASVEPVVVGFTDWRLPDGAMTPVLVVGSNIKTGGLGPWNIVAGSVRALTAPGTVAIDKTYFHRLGVPGIDAKAEIRGLPVRVAAVTQGIRSFTTTPYVFCGLEHAHAYLGLPPSKTSHFLVRIKPGANINRIRQDIQATIPGVRALTPAQFRSRSRLFWLFGTGAGAALYAGALLGLIVGTVIVAQTLYSSTKDHIYEFATLRAIGCSNPYIYRVIADQALINAVMGFAVAALVGFAVVKAYRHKRVAGGDHAGLDRRSIPAHGFHVRRCGGGRDHPRCSR